MQQARQARRTLVTLTVLRQASTGLVLTTWLLTAGARGLDAGQLGLLVAVTAVGTAVLELPTGGLADVVGRRTVLLAAATASLLACLLLAVAGSPATFAAAAGCLAVSAALASGPLEAWFVDHVGGDAVAVRGGLARAGSATGFALAGGGLLGALLSGLAARAGLPAEGTDGLVALSVPSLVAAALAVVEVLALLRLLPPDDRPAATGQDGLLRAVVDDLPATVVAGARLAVTDPVLRWFSARWLLLPVGFLGLELLAPLRLADLLADPVAAAAWAGPLAAGCFVGVGLTAAVAPVLARVGPLAATAATTVAAGACFAAAGAGGVVAVVLGVLAGYALSGPGTALLAPLVHARVDASRRATLLSARSLVGNLAVGVGALGLGAVGDARGTGAAFAVAGAVTALAALPLLGVSRQARSAAPVR